MPVGALVFGRRSVQADVWLNDGQRLALDEALVVGNTLLRLTPGPRKLEVEPEGAYDRQVRMFGKSGQSLLRKCRVGIIGLGGIGSLVAEYLARLGVGHFTLIDDDRVEGLNLSRIVGATSLDAQQERAKVEVSKRVILEGNPDATVRLLAKDVAKESVARQLMECDFIFLAADSMRARLVFNAVVHQYFIPGVQLGSKIRSENNGTLADVMSANRPVRPGHGCLWCNQLIDASELAKEAKTDDERKAQAYGVEEPNPSVISLNAISAAHAVNDFMLDYLGLRPESEVLYYEHFHFLKRKHTFVEPRRDKDCPECSRGGLRYGRADSTDLPSVEG
jgi:hypothetical protein